MTERAPLTPQDCDLRDFKFMPLDVGRLRDSTLASTQTGEECWSAVLLWCASWHQVPAGSLPDDDRVLSRLAGFGRAVGEWERVKAGALHGFVRCSDGRLYHPTVCEKAVEAWAAKLAQGWRTECSRIKKANQRNGTNLPLPTFDEWKASRPSGRYGVVPKDIGDVSSPCLSGNDLQGTGIGTGTGTIEGREGIAGATEPEKPPLAKPLHEPPDDLNDVVTLTDECARVAGVRHIDPGHIAVAMGLVRGWREAGADPPLILDTIRSALLTASRPVHSLKYFDQPVRTEIAKRKALKNGSRTSRRQAPETALMSAALRAMDVPGGDGGSGDLRIAGRA